MDMTVLIAMFPRNMEVIRVVQIVGRKAILEVNVMNLLGRKGFSFVLIAVIKVIFQMSVQNQEEKELSDATTAKKSVTLL